MRLGRGRVIGLQADRWAGIPPGASGWAVRAGTRRPHSSLQEEGGSRGMGRGGRCPGTWVTEDTQPVNRGKMEQTDHKLHERWQNALPVQPGSGSPVRPGLCPAARPADCWSLPAAPACPPSPSPGNDASHAGPGLCILSRNALRLLLRARFPARALVRWGQGKSSPGDHTRGPGACRHFRSRWTPLWDTLLNSGGVRRC